MSSNIPDRVNAASTRSNYSAIESTLSSETPTLAWGCHYDNIAPYKYPLPPPPWSYSPSLSAMAGQVAAASRAPLTAFSGMDLMGELNALRARLDEIEQTQRKIMAELGSIKMQYAVERSMGVTEHWATEVAEGDKARIDALERKLNEIVQLEWVFFLSFK